MNSDVDKLRMSRVTEAHQHLLYNDLRPLIYLLPKRDRHIALNICSESESGKYRLASALMAGLLMNDFHRVIEIAVCHSDLEQWDIFIMCWDNNFTYNVFWSESKHKEKHDEYQRIITYKKLRKENTKFDVSWLTKILPDDLKGRVIKDSRRLTLEGLRQNHCVATYEDRITSRICGILSIFEGGKRWTVEVDTEGYPVQIKTKHDTPPDKEIRKVIFKRFGVEYKGSNQTTSQYILNGRGPAIFIQDARESAIGRIYSRNQQVATVYENRMREIASEATRTGLYNSDD